MRIFVTADPELPVPPVLYGGIERVIALLVGTLAARGHDVTLFARAGSRVPCRLIEYPGRRGQGWSESLRHAAVITREAVMRPPDVIQSFGRLAYLLPLLPTRIPKVMSYQRPVTRRAVTRAWQLSRGTLQFTGCSRQLITPVEDVGQWRVIYNAVSMDAYTPAVAVPTDAPLVFLGRLEHIKGVHVAIDVARRASRRLVIAGNVPDQAEHQAYVREHVLPHVDGDRVSYVGPVDDAAKNALLSRAAALLMPVLWDEPFGIVMAEALACGTPVIGFNRGAVPEVVDHGVTGFTCDDEAAMVLAIGKIDTLDRAACRRAADRRFSQQALADAYERLFDDATRGRDRAAG